MLAVFSDDHERHSGLLEPTGDAMLPSPECPERARSVLAELRARGADNLIAPAAHDDSRLTAVHAPDYVAFLRSAWSDWVAAGEQAANARPATFVGEGMRPMLTDSIHGRLGRYSFDAAAPFVAGSWEAIRRSADIALTGAGLITAGQRFAFALCRPPGHHASRETCGGYCYLNNSAIAAQALLDDGMRRVAVLDVDYHHGNGTQSIFYSRNDVLTISLHADPKDEYPYFAGYADETGAGAGQGLNANYPLPLGTEWGGYEAALRDALGRVRDFAPEAMVIALGLDTFVGDQTTYFGIRSDDYVSMGRLVASAGVPVLTVLEGGYAVGEIGLNAVNFLLGIEAG